MVTGTETVDPTVANTVGGIVSVLAETVRVDVVSPKPTALARTIAEPTATPVTVNVAVLPPPGTVIVAGTATASVVGDSLVSDTATPPAGAAVGRVTVTGAVRLRPTRPLSASV